LAITLVGKIHSNIQVKSTVISDDFRGYLGLKGFTHKTQLITVPKSLLTVWQECLGGVKKNIAMYFTLQCCFICAIDNHCLNLSTSLFHSKHSGFIYHTTTSVYLLICVFLLTVWQECLGGVKKRL
jgi:hypothetical protein